jgi:hypothetical protein
MKFQDFIEQYFAEVSINQYILLHFKQEYNIVYREFDRKYLHFPKLEEIWKIHPLFHQTFT